MKTRFAEAADIPAMARLLAELFEQEADFAPSLETQMRGLKLICENPETGQLIVAEDDAGTLIGMVSLLFLPSTALGTRVAMLEDMVVASSARGNGVGKRLMKTALETAADKGCRRITLLTDADNTPARTFYAASGFSPSKMMVYRTLIEP